MAEGCKHCPFRVGSTMCYDADAMEALDVGHEPSCHAFVGLDAIFFAAPPVHRCHGYDQWCDGAPGFCKPDLITHD